MKSIVSLLRRSRLTARPAAATASTLPRPRVALVALAALVMLAGAGGVHAQSEKSAGAVPAPLAHLGAAELERMFWVCDWATTRAALSRDMFTVCSVAWDELKARKFDGDYDMMIAWWRENKEVAHASLQARRRTAEPAR